ncbi:MAG TPA: carboxypeptidase-like regulatory domain-containing protein, partial [Flavitalea sp.]|nr:carboxypeptidase-like regulatory domain-containing protein [Flavitalea sp.]
MKKLGFVLFRAFVFIIAVFATPHFLFAQEVQVKGKITDATNQHPVEGATIGINNSSKVVATNTAGEFSISVEKGTELIISSVGYETQTVVSTGDYLTVLLKANSQQLQDVVVTALGMTSKKRALGYSVQEIKGDVLTQARETNLVNGLAGRIAGVNVVAGSNSIGGSSKIVIRG